MPHPKYLIFIVLCFLPVLILAQSASMSPCDTLFLQNGQIVPVEIVFINRDTLKYYLCNDASLNLIAIPTHQIEHIAGAAPWNASLPEKDPKNTAINSYSSPYSETDSTRWDKIIFKSDYRELRVQFVQKDLIHYYFNVYGQPGKTFRARIQDVDYLVSAHNIAKAQMQASQPAPKTDIVKRILEKNANLSPASKSPPVRNKIVLGIIIATAILLLEGL